MHPTPFTYKVYFALSIEAKKSRTTAPKPKEPAPEETNESVFGVFLREAGVTLKQAGTSNEIGKTHSFQRQKHTEPPNGMSLTTSCSYLFPPAVDQIVFQKRLLKQLQKSPRFPGVSKKQQRCTISTQGRGIQREAVVFHGHFFAQIVQEFTAGLESHIEDPERFRNCLLPCVPQLSDGDSG